MAEVGREMIWMEPRRGVQGRMGGSGEEGVGCSLEGMAWNMVMEVKGCGRGGSVGGSVGESVSESEPGSLLRRAHRWDQPYPSRVDA